MKRTILLGLGLFSLFATQAFAAEKPEGRLDRYSRLTYKKDFRDQYGRLYDDPSSVRHRRGRKYERRFSFRQNLQNDKLRIYDMHGYTPHRLGFNSAGRRTERWKYHGLGLEYLFDEDGKLLKKSRFMPKANHID